MAQAKAGDKVRVHYTGTLEGGAVFSSTYEENEPFEFTIGERHMLPSFEKAVIGMEEGEKRTVSIPPELAYGAHKKEFVFTMDKASVPPNLELKLGKRLQVRLDGGTTVVATIQAITDNSVILDANDPLAGKTLVFQIELLKIL